MMGAAFAVLGLQPGAGMSEIKRAYAVLLKRTRPEDDAAGFQRLQEAYDACVAFTKRATAEPASHVHVAPLGALDDRAIAEASNDDRDPDSEGEAAGGNVDSLPVVVPIRSRFLPVAPPPPLPAKRKGGLRPTASAEPLLSESALAALLEEIVSEGERQTPHGLGQWLHAHDSLVSLDVQRLVATRLPGFIVERRPAIDTEKLRVIYDYFIGVEYNACHADPRLHQAWERARMEERFRLEIASLRRRYHSTIDRLVLDELLESPKAWRRRLLLALPTMVERIGSLLVVLRGIETQRGAPVLQSESVRFWSALTAPGKLPLRLIGLVHAQLVIGISMVVGGVVLCLGLDPHGMWGMVLIFTLLASSAWFLLRGAGVANHHLAIWREKRLASGAKDHDSILWASGALGALALLLGGIQAFVITQDSVFAFFSCSSSALVAIILFLSGRSQRWEILALALLGSSVAWQAFTTYASELLSPPAAASLACAVGILLAVAADVWHAKTEKIPSKRARMMLNTVAVLLAMLCVFLLLVIWVNSPEERVAPPVVVATPITGTPLATPDTQPLSLSSAPPEDIAPRRFDSTSQAFIALLRATAPWETAHSRLRAFHLDHGPLAGYWIFAGGDWDGPNRFAHFARRSEKYDQLVCEAKVSICRKFRSAMHALPQILDGMGTNEARYTFDSPGLKPRAIQCPSLGLPPRPEESATQDPLHAKILFDSDGHMVYATYEIPSGKPDYDAAMRRLLRACVIEPAMRNGMREGGVADVRIPVQ